MRDLSLDEIRPNLIAGEYLVHPVEDEILLYNLETNFAACLEVRAYDIWQLCDGTNSIEQIIQIYAGENTGYEPDKNVKSMILEVIDQLKSTGLIEAESIPSQLIPLQSDRREFLKRAAITGVPLIVGLPIPAAAQSASCLPLRSLCTTNSECCSSICRIRPNGRGRCRRRP